MKYHNITVNDMKNGDGLRVVLWVSGCKHHCPGCHNPVTWDYNDGLVFDDDAKKELYAHLALSHISGITLSGGDPFYPGNRSDVLKLVKEIRKKFPNKTIWLYTGYKWEGILNTSNMRDTLEYIDVLVDGKYVEELNSVNYRWAGSTNQRVINVKESLNNEGRIVLYASK